MNTQKTENILFDLGGVIINLDPEHAFERFSQLFGHDVRSHIMDDIHNYLFFQQFEIGEISEDEFRVSLKKLAKSQCEDSILDKAWNAMLGEIPKERIKWIEELSKRYHVAILSNTNSIHIRRFHEILRQSSSYQHPEELFHKVYYSHEIKDRKPNKSCFQIVLDDLGMLPETTLFLDDNTENIQTAGEMGMRTVLVERNLLRREQLPNGAE